MFEMLPERHQAHLWGNVMSCRSLFGSLSQDGIALEWLETQAGASTTRLEVDFTSSVEICINFEGEAVFPSSEGPVTLRSNEISVRVAGESSKGSIRKSDVVHKFARILVSARILERLLVGMPDGLHPHVKRFLADPKSCPSGVYTQGMPAHFLSLRQLLIEPPVSPGGAELWYKGKIQEIISQALFVPERGVKNFRQKQKLQKIERIERAKHLLTQDLSFPPSLTLLSQYLSCSPFHLSRLFVDHVGVSIPQYVCNCRMEKARKLLEFQGLGVGETAASVGYKSLSAFHSAFRKRFGRSPSALASQSRC